MSGTLADGGSLHNSLLAEPEGSSALSVSNPIVLNAGSGALRVPSMPVSGGPQSQSLRKAPGIRHALLLKMLPLLIINLFFSILVWINVGCLGSFLRTAVYCDSTDLPEPNDSPNWSGSAQCTDRDLVLNEATTQGGYMGAAGSLVSVISVPFLGSVSDFYGRRWLSVLSASSYLFYFLVFWLSTAFYRPVFWPTLLITTTIQSAMSAWGALSSASAADLSGEVSHTTRNSYGGKHIYVLPYVCLNMIE